MARKLTSCVWVYSDSDFSFFSFLFYFKGVGEGSSWNAFAVKSYIWFTGTVSKNPFFKGFKCCYRGEIYFQKCWICADCDEWCCSGCVKGSYTAHCCCGLPYKVCLQQQVLRHCNFVLLVIASVGLLLYAFIKTWANLCISRDAVLYYEVGGIWSLALDFTDMLKK